MAESSARNCPIPPQSVVLTRTLVLTVQATDPSSPLDPLSYWLYASAPAGAASDDSTGLFSWTPQGDVAPRTYEVTVWVANSQTARLPASACIEVTFDRYTAAPSLGVPHESAKV